MNTIYNRIKGLWSPAWLKISTVFLWIGLAVFLSSFKTAKQLGEAISGTRLTTVRMNSDLSELKAVTHHCRSEFSFVSGKTDLSFVEEQSIRRGHSPMAVQEESLRALQYCSSRYLNLKKFSLDVEYAVFYDSEDFTKPADTKTGKIIRDKNNFYQLEMGNIHILNKEHEFILNERAEFMTIKTRFEKEINPVSMALDSITQFIDHVEKTESGYRYFLNKGRVEKFEIALNEDGYLEHMISWYREPMDFGNGEAKVITQIRYLNFEKNPKINSDVFSLDSYVSVSRKGEVKAREKYKNYYVLNQLQKL